MALPIGAIMKALPVIAPVGSDIGRLVGGGMQKLGNRITGDGTNKHKRRFGNFLSGLGGIVGKIASGIGSIFAPREE